MVRELGAMGYGEYRAHLDFMDLASEQYSFNDHAYRRFVTRIKDAVDPNGVLSPGRYAHLACRLRRRASQGTSDPAAQPRAGRRARWHTAARAAASDHGRKAASRRPRFARSMSRPRAARSSPPRARRSGSWAMRQTSVDAIAAGARVTKGAVYHHFAGKEAAVPRRPRRGRGRGAGARVRGPDPDATPIDQIVAMVDGYLDAALDEEIRRITLIDGPALLGLEPESPPSSRRSRRRCGPSSPRRSRAASSMDVDADVLMQLIGGLALQCGLLIARAPDPDATRAALGRAVDAMLRGLAH